MSQESKIRTIPSGDEEIPSMLEIATQSYKIIQRMKKHATTCQCCKEVLESKDG